MVCGPMLSGACAVLNFWAIIFLAIVGGLFQNQSVGLLEDLPAVGDSRTDSWEVTQKNIEDGYAQNAKNCWIACGISVAVFILTAGRFYMVLRK
uniref:DUF4149 domain-containing protein n=1 Tax=Rhabditophanes sp. KR3021 TaxID=114890 RepID=A0AC35TZJ9_9BILA